MKFRYSYSVLRYVHDTTTDEFVNVGVALYAPDAKFVDVRCRTTFARLSRAFPGMNGAHFRSLMRHIEYSFSKLGQRIRAELPLAPLSKSISQLAHSVLPVDDSSLQWSPAGAGISDNPSKTLSQLFDRMVMRYEEKHEAARRHEDDVWRHFKTTLEEHHILDRFEPRTVAVQDDAVEFQHTWKNGILHCLEPVSFDLARADNIRDKAHRWLGRISSVQGSPEEFQVYFLVAGPSDSKVLLKAYESAISILGKSPGEHKIVREERAEELSTLLKDEIARHDQDELA